MDHGGLKSQHHFRKIIKMCIIFVLAGIFNETTKAIGSVDSFVNFALSNIPNTFLVAHVAEINGTKKLAIMHLFSGLRKWQEHLAYILLWQLKGHLLMEDRCC